LFLRRSGPGADQAANPRKAGARRSSRRRQQLAKRVRTHGDWPLGVARLHLDELGRKHAGKPPAARLGGKRRGSAQAQAEEAERAEAEEAEAEEAAPESECDPNYSGACLDPYASDYDCAGGSGDGPEYTGPVTVVGEDHYGLDSDSDGSACET
jgi:hypothetical protein